MRIVAPAGMARNSIRRGPRPAVAKRSGSNEAAATYGLGTTYGSCSSNWLAACAASTKAGAVVNSNASPGPNGVSTTRR